MAIILHWDSTRLITLQSIINKSETICVLFFSAFFARMENGFKQNFLATLAERNSFLRSSGIFPKKQVKQKLGNVAFLMEIESSCSDFPRKFSCKKTNGYDHTYAYYLLSRFNFSWNFYDDAKLFIRTQTIRILTVSFL